MRRAHSLWLYGCLAPAGEVGVVDEGGVKVAGSRTGGCTVLLGGTQMRMGGTLLDWTGSMQAGRRDGVGVG